MSRLPLAFVAFLSMSLAAIAHAQEVWVDAVNGSDTAGDGTLAQPWKTINHAYLHALTHPVTTVHVLPGTYDVALGEAFPIVLLPGLSIVGVDPQVTILRAPGRYDVFAVFNPNRPVQYRVAGLTLTRELLPDEAYEQQNGIEVISSTQPIDVEVDDCVIEGQISAIVVDAASGTLFVHDCILRNNLHDGIGVGGEGLEVTLDVRIERNVIEGNRRLGVQLFHTWPQLYPTDMDHPGALRPLVSNNTISGNGAGISLSAGWATFVDGDYYGGRIEGRVDANRIQDNSDAGVILRTKGWGKLAPVVSNSIVQGNGVGVRATVERIYGTPQNQSRLVNDSIVANRTAGVVAQVTSFDTLEVVNSIVTDNANDLLGLTLSRVRYCDIGDGEFAGMNGNISADPQFVDAANHDYHLRATSPCIEAGSPNAPAHAFPGLDFDGIARDVDGDRDGVRRPDMGAFEFAPNGLGWRYGNVGAAVGFPSDIVFVNGSAGDPDRVVHAPVGAPIRLDVTAPANGPAIARFALFAYLAIPDATTASPQPAHLGTSAFPTPLNGADPRVLVAFDNLPAAAHARVGAGRLGSHPAPFTVTLPASLARAGSRLTLQGFIADPRSRQGAFAITNAVVVRVP
ncbi:MAG: DUF1565 domain-containing protein [Planctomycetes bacterium]|nr:DUF1565 domain-containing protein [Planctomycetota bacterium]MBI3844295.1 DUF1565 domain-containing protein [Planctomycetota bacterium]